MQTDSYRLAVELEELAAVRDEEARRLRAAAQVLRGELAPSEVEVDPTGNDTSTRGWVSEQEYIDTLMAAPWTREWDADSLANELRRKGKNVASVDAVRTALVRLNKKGILERIGHGRYRIAQPTIDAMTPEAP